MVTDLLLQTTQREPYRALVLSRLTSRSIDHRDRNMCIHYLIVSSPQAVRPTTLSFHLSVNMYAFNVKSYTESECHKQ